MQKSKINKQVQQSNWMQNKHAQVNFSVCVLKKRKFKNWRIKNLGINEVNNGTENGKILLKQIVLLVISLIH